jgi:hypothetical protein
VNYEQCGDSENKKTMSSQWLFLSVMVSSKVIKVFADCKIVSSWGQTLNNHCLQLDGFHGLVSIEEHARAEKNYVQRGPPTAWTRTDSEFVETRRGF